MSKYEIPYINLIIRTFAERFQMSRQAAYAYLQKYNGLSFLIEFYDVEHLQDPEETVDDLIVKCLFLHETFSLLPQKNLCMRTKIEPTHHAIATILIDDIISEMVQYLMDDYGYSLEKSLEMVYQSHTVELLQIEEGELYVQSPAYVYDMLIKELHLYPVFDSNAVGKVAESTQGDCPLV